MATKHGVACGRRLAQAVGKVGGTKHEAAQAIHRHCGVSLLRASRIAHGYTLTEAVTQLKDILRERGTPAEGLAHQRLSRWENGFDTPTLRYLDALCLLYRSRPDRLGFGSDYSTDFPADPTTAPTTGQEAAQNHDPLTAAASEDAMKRRDFVRASAAGFASATHPDSVLTRSGLAGPVPGTDLLTIGDLEEQTERSGYELYTSAPADFIPARMVDFAAAQRLLLTSRSTAVKRRVHRTIAKNAGFIAIRMIDVAPSQDTFNWFRIARQEARNAEDMTVDAWVAGHWADAHVCYGHATVESLRLAQAAQAMGGARSDSTVVYGCLIEAGVQARLGNHKATLDAVRRAEQLYGQLSPDAVAADGIHVPEFFLRWHQSNALSAIGERRLADPLRARTIELPYADKEVVGRTLLHLDEAALLLDAGEIDRGCHVITQAWESLPHEFRQGFVPRRTAEIIAEAGPKASASREFRELKDYLRWTAPYT